jgi:hypothetical protein
MNLRHDIWDFMLLTTLLDIHGTLDVGLQGSENLRSHINGTVGEEVIV